MYVCMYVCIFLLLFPQLWLPPCLISQYVCSFAFFVEGIFTYFRNKLCRLVHCAADDGAIIAGTEKFPPGTVSFDRSRKVLRIRCSDGLDVLCSELRLEGRKTIGASEFANGYLSKSGRRGTKDDDGNENVVQFVSFMCTSK